MTTPTATPTPTTATLAEQLEDAARADVAARPHGTHLAALLPGDGPATPDEVAATDHITGPRPHQFCPDPSTTLTRLRLRAILHRWARIHPTN